LEESVTPAVVPTPVPSSVNDIFGDESDTNGTAPIESVAAIPPMEDPKAVSPPLEEPTVILKEEPVNPVVPLAEDTNPLGAPTEPLDVTPIQPNPSPIVSSGPPPDIFGSAPSSSADIFGNPLDPLGSAPSSSKKKKAAAVEALWDEEDDGDDFFSKPPSIPSASAKPGLPPSLDESDFFGAPEPKKGTPKPTSLDADIFGAPENQKETPKKPSVDSDADIFGAPEPKKETPKTPVLDSTPKPAASAGSNGGGSKAADIFGFKPVDTSSLFNDDNNDDLFS
jgi:hypothetical protein